MMLPMLQSTNAFPIHSFTIITSTTTTNAFPALYQCYYYITYCTNVAEESANAAATDMANTSVAACF